MYVGKMTEDNKPYEPIPCAIHSEYELAIMQQRHMQLVWLDHNAIQHISRVKPLDLITENHAEYLLAQDHEGQSLKIRLDYIRQYRILS